jgi:hypothetical protein
MSSGAKRRSAEEWRDLVEGWRRSGQSRDRYARERGVKATTLGWWASELARRERSESGGLARVGAASFLPVRVVDAAAHAVRSARPSAGRIELVLRGGRKLRVPVGADATWVARVVVAVEQTSSC